MFAPLFGTKRISTSQEPRNMRAVRPQLEHLEERCVPAVDPVLEWNNIALQALRVEHTSVFDPDTIGPTKQARALAIVHAAIFDACNSINGKFQPYLIDAHRPSDGPASKVAAIAQAAHDTLEALFPAQEATFDAALKQSLKRVKNSTMRLHGRMVGMEVADAILDMRSDDGNSDNGAGYMPTGAQGNHDVDPLHPGQGFYGPNYGAVDPFVINQADIASVYRAPPPPALDSPEYIAAFNEVKDKGAKGDLTSPTTRTAEQTEIGIFWGYDGTPGLGTPPVLYNQIVQTIAVQQGNTMAQNARLFALVNLSMTDAGIACWETKYFYDFWRPIMAIRNDNTPLDGTVAQVDWEPLGAPASNPFPGQTNFTPPFPAYTSGHATFGASTFQILARFYRTDNISFTIGSDEFNGMTRDQDGTVRPIVYRSYSSFSQAKVENAESRIWLGIHWRFDAVQGIAMGDAIANAVFTSVLRPK